MVLVSGHVNTLIRALRGIVFRPEAIAEVFKGFVCFFSYFRVFRSQFM